MSENVILETDVEAELKRAIYEAIAILDNDMFVSRAQNCRTRLQDALDEYGEPEYDIE